ncbi:MAG: hypothetical protein JWM95_3876 [Gemmatimonadetes bacterium]|nr:hypothetical protein [Gemmatimonadota bacterium]
MKPKLPFASFAVALSLGVTLTASGQELATYGSLEAAGLGEGSALIGATVSGSQKGWGPIAAIIAQTYRYQDGISSHATASAVSPSVGLQYRMTDGAVQAAVGYTFVSTEVSGVFAGSENGGRSGVFGSVQGNYWGSGENSAQFIGAYNFKSDYYWTRGRAAHRISPPVYLGGEVVVQGSQDFTPSIMRYEVGPTIEYRVSPEFRVGASGGLRGGNNSAVNTGYARIEFLLLSRL